MDGQVAVETPEPEPAPEMSREELRAALARLDPEKVAEAIERAPWPPGEDGGEDGPRWVVMREPPQ